MRFELAPDNRGADNETILQDLRRVARDLKKDSLSKEEYDGLGRFHSATVRRRFGGWHKSLELSGLRVSENYHEKLSDEELFRNLETIWRALGRQPIKDDMRLPFSRNSAITYSRRFGSWRKALEAFVESVNRGETDDEAATASAAALQPNASAQSSALQSVSRTPRAPGWRLRYLVMHRDEFKCRYCGASPSATPGVVLVLDHRTPWAKGGKTTFENLQTLCKRCNGGKSDLLIDVEEVV